MTENQNFDKCEFSRAAFPKGTYDNCRFTNCNFYEADLSGYVFRECVFRGCDLSLAIFKNTTFSDVQFIDSKLLGVQFQLCNSFLFSVGFAHCVLKMAMFSKLKLKKYRFENCNLQEADFSETDLSASVFDCCDLQRAVFYNSNLEKADFISSYNYSIDPEHNRIKKASFSRQGVIGLLDKYNIIIE